MENHSDDKMQQTVRDLSAVGYTVKEISEVIEIDPEDLEEIFTNKEFALTRAYLAGKHELKYKTRKSIADLAANGSVPAAMKMLELLQIQESNEGHY